MTTDTFWLKDARILVDCAMGRTPADLVIRGGRWVAVQTGEVIPNTDIAVIAERIAYVGQDASHCIGPKHVWWMPMGGFWCRGFWMPICTWNPAC